MFPKLEITCIISLFWIMSKASTIEFTSAPNKDSMYAQAWTRVPELSKQAVDLLLKFCIVATYVWKLNWDPWMVQLSFRTWCVAIVTLCLPPDETEMRIYSSTMEPPAQRQLLKMIQSCFLNGKLDITTSLLLSSQDFEPFVLKTRINWLKRLLR